MTEAATAIDDPCAEPPPGTTKGGPTILISHKPDPVWARSIARFANRFSLEPTVVDNRLRAAAAVWRHESHRETASAAKVWRGPNARSSLPADGILEFGFGDPPRWLRRVRSRSRRPGHLAAQHPEDTQTELKTLGQDALALRDRILALGMEAREALGVGTWRREQIEPIAALVVERLQVDLAVLSTAAYAARNQPSAERALKAGRPGFTPADRKLVVELKRAWSDLTGLKARAYYNDMKIPPAQISQGARAVQLAFRLITGRRLGDRSLIDLLRQR